MAFEKYDYIEIPLNIFWSTLKISTIALYSILAFWGAWYLVFKFGIIGIEPKDETLISIIFYILMGVLGVNLFAAFLHFYLEEKYNRSRGK